MSTTAAPELDRLVERLRTGGDRAPVDQVLAAVAAWRRPLRIQVTGRARAGKSTLLRALALLSAEETPPVDEPDVPVPVLDADLIVYVLGGALRDGDRGVLATLPADRTVVVLNKADAVGTGWSEVVATAGQCARGIAMPVFPVVADLAARTRAGIPDQHELTVLARHTAAADSLTLTPELFTAATAGTDVDDRAALLDRWGLYGVACALAALRHQPDLGPQSLLQVLHAGSGIDELYAELHTRYEQVTARRGGEFLDELARIAARAVSGGARELIEDYLAGTEAKWLGLCAGLAQPEVRHLGAGYPQPYPADADDALTRARRWRAVVASDLPPAARRAAVRVHNGYVQLWERMSGAGL
ncbi:hypothetical protein [Nocardia stercoris]|uniref:hypothetical protein n=1 Tax=Nocardia stercoris TaxID=2483361 RepID=UPI001F456EF9|nr:hypothetical protein [Nocardia stercoris]